MAELTLESLARRVEVLEAALIDKTARPQKDWRKVIGKFRDSEFMRAVDEECARQRQLEREEAQREEPAA